MNGLLGIVPDDPQSRDSRAVDSRQCVVHGGNCPVAAGPILIERLIDENQRNRFVGPAGRERACGEHRLCQPRIAQQIRNVGCVPLREQYMQEIGIALKCFR